MLKMFQLWRLLYMKHLFSKSIFLVVILLNSIAYVRAAEVIVVRTPSSTFAKTLAIPGNIVSILASTTRTITSTLSFATDRTARLSQTFAERPALLAPVAALATIGYVLYASYQNSCSQHTYEKAVKLLNALDPNPFNRTGNSDLQFIGWRLNSVPDNRNWVTASDIIGNDHRVVQALADDLSSFTNLCSCPHVPHKDRIVKALTYEIERINEVLDGLKPYCSIVNTYNDPYIQEDAKNMLNISSQKACELRQYMQDHTTISWSDPFKSPFKFVQKLVRRCIYPRDGYIGSIYWQLIELRTRLEAIKYVLLQANVVIGQPLQQVVVGARTAHHNACAAVCCVRK